MTENERTVYKKVCKDCGLEFLVYSLKSRRALCDDCCKKRKKITDKKYRENKRINNKKTPSYERKSLKQVERERAIYNKTHRTSLTYGQFVMLIEGK